MREFLVKHGTEIELGKRGEHLARCVVFDISDWQKTYGEGRAHLLHQRNGDKAPYPCVVEMVDSKVLWTLNEVDLDVAGRGRAELQYFVGDVRVKSETWFTRTDFAMNNEGPVPEEPAENWLDTMLELGNQTQENAEAADDSAKAAQDSASAAAESAEAAKNSEAYTREVAEGVVAEAEQKIMEHVTRAAESAESASADSEDAKTSAESAAASEEVAKAAEQAAKEAQEAAEKARDEATAIAGGDFATNADLESHTGNKSNPHGVTAAQVGALALDGSNAMKAETLRLNNDLGYVAAYAANTALNSSPGASAGDRTALILWNERNLATSLALRKYSGGSVVGDEIVYHTGNKPTAADVGAAPTGFGLGTNAKVLTSADDLNTVWKNGWYYWGTPSPKNAPPQTSSNNPDYTIMRVTSRTSTEVLQEYWSLNLSFKSQSQRVYVNGAWGPLEWVNPQLTQNYTIEYRTIERINGKAVYKRNNGGIIEYRLDGETEWKPYASVVGAAPAGFGLGTSVVPAPNTDVQSDANAIKGSGFYRAITNTAFDAYGWSYIIHVHYGSGDWTQVNWHPSRDLGVKVRECKSGTIGEWKNFLSVAGGGVPKVDITDTTPTSATTYYPLYTTNNSGVQTVRANKDLYYYDMGTASYFNVGSSDQKGGLTLHASNGKYVNVVAPDAPTGNRDITLPDVSGTVYTTGNKPSAADVGAVGKTGDQTMTGSLMVGTSGNHNTRIHSQGVGIRIVPEGGWARGYGAASSYDTSKSYGSFGFYGTDDSLGHLYMGWGSNSYSEENCLAVSASKLKYKGKNVLHTGNVVASATDITAGSSASWQQYLVYE